jgi:hypothetical protein
MCLDSSRKNIRHFCRAKGSGGMICATFITLLLVPVIYSIFVLDLKIIKWEAAGTPNSELQQPEAADDKVDTAQIMVKDG